MYNDKFAVAIKVNGKVVREDKDTVYLPFGSEYSILLKNLNSVRSSVIISIDGEDISNDKTKLIIDGNDTIELKRYLTDDHAFKFIEKTKEISDYRGNRIDDGLIRIEYWFEIPFTNIPYINYLYMPNGTGDPQYNTYTTDKVWCCTNTPSTTEPMKCISESSLNGITVKGNKTNQYFKSTTGITEEMQSHVMVINLKGESSNASKIENIIFTDSKLKCSTCGKMNKSSSKFCNRCGTALI